MREGVRHVELGNSVSRSFARGALLISGMVNVDRLNASIYFLTLLRDIRSCLAVRALLKVSTAHMRKSFRIVDAESADCGMNGSFPE